ncbi:MAG TPA: hypothetical protein PKJ99_06865 [Thermoanaerobaculales bacterium]|nr:hypothetical protein [Thermoanaerobaculales bacterium]HPA81406.1 hypothetical protein [Thermoanaerobaculales bacterium]HQL30232.1 hypothetical protein [Thermoanaerobaculales bacterium]
MRRAVVLLIVMLGAAASVAALDAYPKTTLAEDATATWCGYCPNAYAGLEVVHSQYDYGQFISARYYASTGSYGSPEIDAAIAYYGVSGYPTVIFNGQTMVVGAGAITATGASYLPIVEAASFQPAPIRIEIDSFDPASGDIQATVTMYSETDALAGDHIRFLLLEDNLTSLHTRATRDIINDTITLSGAGSTAVFNRSFDVDPGWNQANLHAVVFVQRAADKEVLQADSSYDKPDYSVRAMVPFDRVKIGPSSGTQPSPPFTLANVGLADTFTIELVVDHAPAGWAASYWDDLGGNHTGPWSFSLGVQESTEFSIDVTPATPGYMKFHLEVSSPNLTAPLIIPFTYLSDDLDVLIVDDDGAQGYESYYTTALDTLGMLYGVWDLNAGKLTDDVLQAYSVLIWQIGESYPTLDADDRDFLTNHLDNGGSLFLTGQDIGWELNTSDSGNYDPTWYHDYLHANYVRDDTNILYLNGVAGDPISDGLTLHIAGGDGANNQEYPDEIAPRDSDATAILNYQGDGVGGIRAASAASGARVVYLGFGFEAIDNAQHRADLLGPALQWLGAGELFSDGFESGDTTAWSATVP